MAGLKRKDNSFQHVKISGFDSAALDAFGRWRVSTPLTVFESKLLGSDDEPLLWDEQLESGGGITATTPTTTKPYIDFVTTANTAGVFTRQTFRRFNYQVGKGNFIQMSGVLALTEGGVGSRKCIGPFDNNDGLFFEDANNVIKTTIRSNVTGSVVEETTDQKDWNLDTLDGSGDDDNPSGEKLDATKAQYFSFDYQWSSGRVRFGVELDGVLTYVHEHHHSNHENVPWCASPNLPLRYSITTTADSPATSMRVINCAVISEGGVEDRGIVRHKGTRGTHIDANTENTLYAIMGIRLKSTHLGADIKVLGGSLLETQGNKTYEWIFIFNPTVADTFTYSDLSNSAVQVALGATANTVTAGHHIGGQFANSTQKGGVAGATIETELRLGSAIDGTPDTLVLCAGPVGGSSNIDIEGSLTWRETF